MRKITVHKSDLQIPSIGLGCMRISALPDQNTVNHLLETSMEQGVNFFDHADIYGGGECERIFGKWLAEKKREDMIIQSKCGFRQGQFDFSKEYILQSADGILQRLGTEYLDIFLLHRPDTLMEPDEVAEAFEELHKAGKVRYFGVSNMTPYQIELLNEACGGKILFNQVQFSVAHCGMIDSSLNANMYIPEAINRDNGLLEYARLKKLTLQAWSPFQYGMFEGTYIGSEKYPELNRKLNEIGEKYHLTPNAVAVAWIMRHPAKIQTIVGTTNAQRFAECCEAARVELTREEWYALYLAAGKKLP